MIDASSIDLDGRQTDQGSGATVQRNSKEDWGTSTERTTIGGRRAAMRVVMDRLSGMVVIYEQDAAPGEAGPRTLVFEAQTTSVRLEKFPAEWRRLDEETLLGLRQPHS